MHRVRRARSEDVDKIAAMRVLLWPDGSLEEHRTEAEAMLATGMNGSLPAATFVAESQDGLLTGFIDVGLRSHADASEAISRQRCLRHHSSAARINSPPIPCWRCSSPTNHPSMKPIARSGPRV